LEYILQSPNRCNISDELIGNDEKAAHSEKIASGMRTTFCSFRRENSCHKNEPVIELAYPKKKIMDGPLHPKYRWISSA
jgi:hypothetical protein